MQRSVTLIGAGCGTMDTLTAQAADRLRRAALILGPARLLKELPPDCPGDRLAAFTCADQLEQILRTTGDVCVLFSGDTGFYSGARMLCEALGREGIPFELLPGISSVQALAARLGRAWQDWILTSAHGRCIDLLPLVSRGAPVCILTDAGAGSPAALCQELTAAGLGTLTVTVGEALTCPEERILCGSAESFTSQTFSPLSILLVEPAPRCDVTVPGIPDGAFLRGGVPMTKQEVRCLIPARLALRRDDVCWDIGAGTGSVSVELALQCRRVWALERSAEAVSLMEQNRRKFCAWNLSILHGTAPEALQGMPTPDAVFIGGSGGHLREILQTAASCNPSARFCITAISMETLAEALGVLREMGVEPDICQLAAHRVRQAGGHHLLTAMNPTFLISGALR